MGIFILPSTLGKSKQGEIFKADEIRISTINFGTKDCVVLQSRSLKGTTELFENRNRSQFSGYSQLNQHLCEWLKLLKKQRYAGRSLISKERIKYERVYMVMKMVQSSKVTYAKSTYKKDIISAITPYQLVGDIHFVGTQQKIKQVFTGWYL